jgi:hypothetical protein
MDVGTLTIPSGETMNGKGVTQIVGTRSSTAARALESEATNDALERIKWLEPQE